MSNAPIPPTGAVPQVYRDHLEAVTGGDTTRLRELWQPAGVLEFPYAESVGSAKRLEGVEAIIDYFSGLGLFGPFTFTDLRAWKIQDTEEYLLEMHGSSTLNATGAPYEQDYLVRFGIAADGRLSWMREFWDPTRT